MKAPILLFSYLVFIIFCLRKLIAIINHLKKTRQKLRLLATVDNMLLMFEVARSVANCKIRCSRVIVFVFALWQLDRAHMSSCSIQQREKFCAVAISLSDTACSLLSLIILAEFFLFFFTMTWSPIVDLFSYLDAESTKIATATQQQQQQQQLHHFT